MNHFFPNEFDAPKAAFGQIVKDQYACRDACIAKAPKCGGFTYFAQRVEGLAEIGKCWLKANPEHDKVNEPGPYKYLPYRATISGDISCPGIRKGIGSPDILTCLHINTYLQVSTLKQVS